MTSVKNVRKAKQKHDQRQAGRDSALNQARKGTEGSKLNDRVSGAFRSDRRRNS